MREDFYEILERIIPEDELPQIAKKLEDEDIIKIDSYDYDDLHEIDIPLGYKISITVECARKNNDIARAPCEILDKDVRKFIEYCCKEFCKGEDWQKEVYDFLKAEKIWDMETFIRIPECFWPAMAFKSAGLKKALKKKIREEINLLQDQQPSTPLKNLEERSTRRVVFQDQQPSTSQQNVRKSTENSTMGSLKRNTLVENPTKDVFEPNTSFEPAAPVPAAHEVTNAFGLDWSNSKYHIPTNVNLEAVFGTGDNEARKTFHYLKTDIFKKQNYNKRNLTIVSRIIVDDIIKEGKRFFPDNPTKHYKPPTYIMQNAARALADELPGLMIEILSPEQRDLDTREKKKIVEQYFYETDERSRPKGSLYARLTTLKQSKAIQHELGNPKKKRKSNGKEIVEKSCEEYYDKPTENTNCKMYPELTENLRSPALHKNVQQQQFENTLLRIAGLNPPTKRDDIYLTPTYNDFDTRRFDEPSTSKHVVELPFRTNRYTDFDPRRYDAPFTTKHIPTERIDVPPKEKHDQRLMNRQQQKTDAEPIKAPSYILKLNMLDSTIENNEVIFRAFQKLLIDDRSNFYEEQFIAHKDFLSRISTLFFSKESKSIVMCLVDAYLEKYHRKTMAEVLKQFQNCLKTYERADKVKFDVYNIGQKWLSSYLSMALESSSITDKKKIASEIAIKIKHEEWTSNDINKHVYPVIVFSDIRGTHCVGYSISNSQQQFDTSNEMLIIVIINVLYIMLNISYPISTKTFFEGFKYTFIYNDEQRKDTKLNRTAQYYVNHILQPIQIGCDDDDNRREYPPRPNLNEEDPDYAAVSDNLYELDPEEEQAGKYVKISPKSPEIPKKVFLGNFLQKKSKKEKKKQTASQPRGFEQQEYDYCHSQRYNMRTRRMKNELDDDTDFYDSQSKNKKQTASQPRAEQQEYDYYYHSQRPRYMKEELDDDSD